MTIKELKIILDKLPEVAVIYPYEGELVGIGIRDLITDKRAFIDTKNNELIENEF